MGLLSGAACAPAERADLVGLFLSCIAITPPPKLVSNPKSNGGLLEPGRKSLLAMRAESWRKCRLLAVKSKEDERSLSMELQQETPKSHPATLMVPVATPFHVIFSLTPRHAGNLTGHN
jgi:hypothetical protein